MPSANRIILLRDTNGDGVADAAACSSRACTRRSAWRWSAQLYVADTDALLRFPYKAGETQITTPGVKVADLPGGPIDHHWTKNVVASPDGGALCHGRLEQQRRRERHRRRGGPRGDLGGRSRDGRHAHLRHRACATRTASTSSRRPGTLWAVVDERDEIGDDLVPDYLTSVKDGGFYGWPYSYWGDHVDAG